MSDWTASDWTVSGWTVSDWTVSDWTVSDWTVSAGTGTVTQEQEQLLSAPIQGGGGGVMPALTPIVRCHMRIVRVYGLCRLLRVAWSLAAHRRIAWSTNTVRILQG